MPQAKVLRLLRYDANKWWYFQTLRKQGQIEKARKLERASIRDEVKFIRENINRAMQTHRTDCIEFLDKPRNQPFDLKPMVSSYTTTVSSCHAGGFAAWVYCYANRIGLKLTAKQYDLV